MKIKVSRKRTDIMLTLFPPFLKFNPLSRACKVQDFCLIGFLKSTTNYDKS